MVSNCRIRLRLSCDRLFLGIVPPPLRPTILELLLMMMGDERGMDRRIVVG